MSKDIFTQYTKKKNCNAGRRGYCGWKRENETVISPKNYGIFLESKKRRNRNGYCKEM